MRRGKQIYDWFPLWSDKWLFGSTRHELTHEQRAIWTDLMALANKDDGYVRANETTPYPNEQLSGLLCCSQDLLKSTITRCIETVKLKDTGNGILYVVNWKEYQLSGRYKRLIAENLEEASGKTDTSNLVLSSFLVFWERYPRRVGKKSAFKSWTRLIDKEKKDPAVVMKSLDFYISEIGRLQTKSDFIKYPATFLNAEPWNDGPQEIENKKDGMAATLEIMRREEAGRSKS